MRVVQSSALERFPEFVISLFPDAPRAALIFANSLMKVVAEYPADSELYPVYRDFSMQVCHFLKGIIAQNDIELLAMTFHLLSRTVVRHLPPVFEQDNGLLPYLFETAIRLLRPGCMRLIEYCLRFLARTIMVSPIDPPESIIEKVLEITATDISEVAIAYSLHLLYICLKNDHYINFLQNLFMQILSDLIITKFDDFAVDFVERPSWRDAGSSGGQLVRVFLQKFGEFVQPMLTWVTSTSGAVLRSSIALLSHLADFLVEGAPEVFMEFVGWLICGFREGDDGLKLQILELLPKCPFFECSLEFLSAVISELNNP
jgi:hypothetical protein